MINENVIKIFFMDEINAKFRFILLCMDNSNKAKTKEVGEWIHKQRKYDKISNVTSKEEIIRVNTLLLF